MKPRIGNPFFVLGLDHDASGPEIERQGQKLLAQLEGGIAGASTFRTPLGPETRTADLVRQALSDLRDPDRRLVAEVWARAPRATLDPMDLPDARGLRRVPRVPR
jgi:hypothetical protein